MSKSVLLAFIALFSGLLVAVSIGPKDADDTPLVNESGEQVVMVTLVDMDAGICFGPNNLRMEFRPIDETPADCLRSLTEVTGRFAARRIPAGTILTAEMITSNEAAGLSAIPDGYRMCVIHTSLPPTLLPQLQPGLRVDVLAYLPQSSTVPVPTTRKVATAARIHQVHQDVDQNITPISTTKITPCSVSLYVKQTEVQPLLLAAENGLFRLSLLGSPSNLANSEADDFTYQQLIASRPARGNPALLIHDQSRQSQPSPTEEKPPEDLMTREHADAAIEAAVQQAVQLALAAVEAKQQENRPTAQQPHWTMEVLTPRGVTHYSWATSATKPTVTASTQQPEGFGELQATLLRIQTARKDGGQDSQRK